ncbi:MAG: hypothetical protein EOL90_09375 [Spartobacteria bacterium]|nr:hypothetical protein [Spartobacteria bacterium]
MTDRARPRLPVRRPLLVFALWLGFALVVTVALVTTIIFREPAALVPAVLAGAITIWGTEKWA